ncbi:unnamed protein product [Candidula unifasciata]|uniref:VWFA domain-containing protein n=1 Tax=Candidula unifasciata TaxID=100452 RepID=A0A8S3ZXU2_9EUPU|nr:unnamed protein product [Candidula unifasciata]
MIFISFPTISFTGWTNKEADVYFLIDSSASIWIMDYMKLLQFVADLVSDMDLSLSATRVGVGLFSSHHRLHIPLNNNWSKEKIRQEIVTAPYLRGDTYLSRALQGMRAEGLSSSMTRASATRIGVLITDGMSRHKQLTADNATLAKMDGIFLFTVGVGHGVDHDELREIASDPKKEFNYHVPSFDFLKEIRLKLSHRMSEVGLMQGDEGTCGDKDKVDVVFVFDQAAFGDHATQLIRSFIMSLVADFSMNTGNVRVGIVSSTCHENDKMLGQYVTKDDFISALKSIETPEISSLIKRSHQESFLSRNGGRFDAKHRMVLLLHDRGRKVIETVRQVSKSKHAGVEVFVIQLGTDYSKEFVHRLASSIDNVMYVESPSNLSTTDSKQTFNRMFCKDL